MAMGRRRDYSLTGPENHLAQEKGWVAAQWYTSPIPRKRMKELMQRRNGPAIRDTIVWFVLLALSGYLAYRSWGTWWSVPAFFAYGILYATPGDSRWHECGHGTAFKTPWMNEVIYQIASFMVLRSATPWRWSHSRHHSDTYIVGRDPEILTERPPLWKILWMQVLHLYGGPKEIRRFGLHCFGKVDAAENEYIPVSERPKAFREARVYLFILAAVLALSIWKHSLLPTLFVVLPSFYGSIVVLLFGMTQHLGLFEDVLDHRLNTRTIDMGPLLRFLYWNMNYHIEHHMFPMVPYHALPALHKEMKGDCPAPCRGFGAALREVVYALHRQKGDPAYTRVRVLPPTARPYLYGVQGQEEMVRRVQAVAKASGAPWVKIGGAAYGA